MTRLSHRDLEALLTAASELYAVTDPNRLPDIALRIVARVIDVEAVTYDEVDAATGALTLRQFPEIPGVGDVIPTIAAHLHTHPVIPSFHAKNPRPVKVSDFATLNEFRQTAIYNEVYRWFGVRHQMTHFPQIPQPPGILGSSFTLSRFKRDFSERDRQALAHLAPHFRQAYINAVALHGFRTRENLMLHGNTATRQEVIFIDAQDRVLCLSSRAAAWLEHYCRGGKKTTGLPDELRRWFSNQQHHADGVIKSRGPLVLTNEAGRLIVRWFNDLEGNQMLLLSEQQSMFSVDRLGTLGLTRREAEVLRWMAEGKTDEEIGTILGISVHTAHKHAQNIMTKLDAHNRAAVLLRVFEMGSA